MKVKFIFLFATAFSFLKAVAISGVPLGFIENKGQLIDQDEKQNTEVLYYLRTKELSVYLNKTGFSYEVLKPTESTERLLRNIFDRENTANNRFAFLIDRVDFVFPGKPTSIVESEAFEHKTHFYTQPDTSIHQVRTFKKITYKDVVPGIDVEFLVQDGSFKYNILIHPGSEHVFYMDVKGARKLSLEDNALHIATEFNEIIEKIPYVYVENSQGQKREVVCDFLVDFKNERLKFALPKYDNQKELLVIDPLPNVMWGTYFGGANYDAVTNMALDSSENVLLVGMTMSANNIATTGAHSTVAYGDLDGFVAKFNSQGTLLWATYYGNTGADRPYGIATDSALNVYIGGTTFSQMGIVTPGAYQTILESPDDAFLVKFNENGVRQWGTYYGGNGHEFVSDITADANGNIFLTGHTRSTNLIATAGTHQTGFTGTEIAFLAKFSTTGALIFGTYFGGNLVDGGQAVRVDHSGNILLAGNTRSTTGIATMGMPQTSLYGYMDGFLAKFNPNGTLNWSRYVGGNFSDKILSLSVDEFDNIYAVGDTESTDSISTPGSFQPVRASSEDGFLIRFNPNGIKLWGTYIGGTSSEYMHASAYKKGKVYIGGNTDSFNNISTPNTHQTTYQGMYDGFVMRFDTTGMRNWGTYYGGELGDGIIAIQPTEYNHLFIAGSSNSISFGIAYGNSHQSVFGGGSNDGYVARLCEPVPMFSSDTVYTCAGQITTIQANLGTSYQWSTGSTDSFIDYSESTPGTEQIYVLGFDTYGCKTDTSFITIINNPTPTVPTISFVNDTLFSSSSQDNSWYLDGNFTGSNATFFVPVQNGSYAVTVTNQFGCSSTSLPFVYEWESVFENQENFFAIYPNPASEILSILWASGIVVDEYRIYDFSGRLIYQDKPQPGVNQVSININELSSGVYFIETQTQKNSYTLRFVVAR